MSALAVQHGLKIHEGKGVEIVGEARPARWRLAVVPVSKHRTLTEYSMPVENTKLALAGADFHHEQICTGRVALMRPFLIPASIAV